MIPWERKRPLNVPALLHFVYVLKQESGFIKFFLGETTRTFLNGTLASGLSLTTVGHYLVVITVLELISC